MERRSQNSLVLQQLQELASNLFLDLRQHHPHLVKNLSLDQKTLNKRFSEEGIGFLTSTLPRISKALIKGLEIGFFQCPEGFKKKKGTMLPRFLGGLLTDVFDDDGQLRPEPCQIAINDVIQLSSLFYKLDLPYSQKSEKKVIQNFVETEYELKRLTIQPDETLERAADLVKVILKGFDPFEIKPRHGPGAVATRERFEHKWTFSRKYKNLHKVYPYYEYFVPSRSSLLRNIRAYKSFDSYDSGTARVVLVPKDSRGPRLISMEPLEYQFIQQGLSKALVRQLEDKSFMTRRKINFTDQSINRDLALRNSLSKDYATLDMKEASDRVSVQLVQYIFSKRRDVLKALLATRTTGTILPDGTYLELDKYAPMGSALCFPVEALVFWVLAEVLRRRDGISGKVFVYGDDIIVPRKLAPVLFREFPNYGLKFNEDKCFIDGWFRESCGMDAHRGIQCTPVRMRKLLPRSKKEASALVSGIEFSNHLWQRGFWNSSTYVKNVCENIQHVGVVRSPKENFGGLSYVSFTTKGVICDNRTRLRFKKDVQRYQFLVATSKSVSSKRDWDGEPRLFSNLVGQVTQANTVPHAVSIKMRWVSVL